MRLYADFFARYRWLVASALAVFTGLAVWGHMHEASVAQRAPREPRADEETLEEVSRDFGRGGGDGFLLIEADDLFSQPAIAAIRRVVAALEQLDEVAGVVWIDQIPTFNAFGLPGRMLPDDDAPAEQFKEARERVLAHPLIRGQLVSADGSTLLMPLSFDWESVGNPRQAIPKMLETARQSTDDDVLQIRMTGRIPLFVAQQQAFDRDHEKFQWIGYVMVIVLAAIMFRGVSAVIIVAAGPALGVFWTLGLLQFMNDPPNPLTGVILPIMLTMVGFTDGVHLMVHIRKLRAEGVSAIDASQSAIHHLGMACFLTSLTTAVGFGSLLVADAEVIQRFGRACAIGVVVTFVSVVSVIPLLCSTPLGRRVHAGHEHDYVGRNLHRLGGFIDWIIKRHRLVTLGGIVTTATLLAVALTLRPDNKFEFLLPTRTEEYQALVRGDEAFGGMQFVQVLVEWPESVPTDSREIVTALADVEKLLQAEPLTHAPLSLLNLLASLPGKEGDLAARMPLLTFLPEAATERFYLPDARRAVVAAHIQDLGIARLQPAFLDVETKLAELAQRHAGFRFELTGEPVVRGRQLWQIVNDLASSLGLAAAIILIVMGVVYRSAKIGLITVIPNLFPLVVTAGLLVVLGRSLEMASVCAFTICLGIAVDDTIHFLSRFQRELGVDGDVQGAIHRSFIGVGTALVMTTIILCCGFSTVLTSEMPGNQVFGLMACATIGAALIGDLIFLPAMLTWFLASPDGAKQQDDEYEDSLRQTPAAVADEG